MGKLPSFTKYAFMRNPHVYVHQLQWRYFGKVRWLRDKFHRYIYMPDKSVKFDMLLDELLYLKKNPCSKDFAHYLTIKT